MIKIVETCKTCIGFCCRYFIVPVKVTDKIKEDYELFLKYHNCKLIFHMGKHIIKIPIPCKHLNLETGKCLIYGKEERPVLCNSADCIKKDKEYYEKVSVE